MNTSGEVTFAARYTPWGDTLESSGTGNISIGYLGGLMDTATGLLYMGNGNYYDPSTGRFLNRNVNPNGTNPYVPWGGEPSAALMAPLALLSLFYSRKKKRGTLDTIIILLVLGVSLSLGLAACGSNPPPPTLMVVITTTPGQHVAVLENASGTPLATYPLPSAPPVVVATPCPTVTMNLVYTGTPEPTEDIFHITGNTLAHQNMEEYLKSESDALLLARLAIGEGVEGSTIDQNYIMWTVKIRAEVGYSNYRAGTYQIAPTPTSIKQEIFATNQYQSITGQNGVGGIITGNNWAIVTEQTNCGSSFVRMGNPCSDLDLQRLKSAYSDAQAILAQNVKNAPDQIKDFDTYISPDSPGSICSTYEDKTHLRPMAQYNNGSKFFDCAYVDNVWLFPDFSAKSNWMPPMSTPTP